MKHRNYDPLHPNYNPVREQLAALVDREGIVDVLGLLTEVCAGIGEDFDHAGDPWGAEWAQLAAIVRSATDFAALRFIHNDEEEPSMTRQAFLALFAVPGDAIEFEDRALSVGNEFLPDCARAVRDGDDPTPEYWAWLCDQVQS